MPGALRSPLPWSALAASLLLLSGCTTAPQDGPSAGDPTVEIDEARPDPSFGAVATGPAAAPDLEATTAAAPRLVPGEWWRIRFSSSLFPDTPELIRVVAGVEPEGYLIGMPHAGWFKEAIAYHAPAFGDVGSDLSYELHNIRFEPLRFPLVQGATWRTNFGGSEYVATVESADEWTAEVRFEAPEQDPQPTDPAYGALAPVDADAGMSLVYDARQHEVVAFRSVIGQWEVVEHGYGFEGWVTVPRGLHTAIDHGQFLAAAPGEPLLTRSVQIEGGFNRLTLLQGVYALGPGIYRVRATAPDGTEYVTESNGQPSFVLRFHEAADPDGTWTVEDLAAGPGGTYSMGMAYHQYDVRLPDGARRSDHSHPVIR